MKYEELLDWARKRPLWQQDALRRLAQHGELTAEDREALQIQIRQEVGFPVKTAPKPVPLAAEHLNRAASNAPKTVLGSLGPIRHVDRLSPDQPPLWFAVNGITLVYGPNASGKSGYCRIVKQLCRSRNSAKLRGNIYDVEAPYPEVTVAFRVGGDDQPKRECVWSSDQEPPIELSRISVFDTATARVYVDKERRIEFLPYELDLMHKLGLVCQDFDNVFKKHLKTVDAMVNTPLPKGYHEGTVVQATLASVVSSAVLSDLPSEQNLRELGIWTAEMQEEITATAEQLGQDPQIKIRLRIEAKQALEIVKGEISTIENNLADTAITTFHQSQQTAEARRRAADAAASDLFSDQPISGLGSSEWRQMLTYARDFAAIAFSSDVLPPQLANGGRCVLCLQDLGEDAAARMAAFDEYIVGRAAKESDTAARIFAEYRDKLAIFKIRSRHEVETLLAVYAALSDACKRGAATIGAFFESAGERLKAIQDAIREEQFDALADIDPLPDSPASFLESEINRLDDEIAKLEDIDRDEQGLDKLRAKHDDLSDRKKLSEEIELVVERRNRLEERHRLDGCSKLCRSGPITRRITSRRREILTPTLKAALHRECKRLQLTHIPLGLSDRGQEGESITKIALNSQQKITNNSDILSEGEQRALALACFLAELHEIDSDHAIIVDDPVSSLDDGRMQDVAKRLAEEAAKGRQVIVFTHNILFHHILSTEARRAGICLHPEWMSSTGGDRFGLIDEAQKPWQMKRVHERLDEISKDFSKFTNNEYDHTDQKFRPDIINLYTKMRETWERTIEEILFNNVVRRFRPEIMTQRLEQACFCPLTDYPDIYEGMKRCSSYSGHDPAPESPHPLPTYKQIDDDIKYLRDYVSKVIERSKQLRKSSKYEEGITPKFL